MPALRDTKLTLVFQTAEDAAAVIQQINTLGHVELTTATGQDVYATLDPDQQVDIDVAHVLARTASAALRASQEPPY